MNDSLPFTSLKRGFSPEGHAKSRLFDLIGDLYGEVAELRDMLRELGVLLDEVLRDD